MSSFTILKKITKNKLLATLLFSVSLGGLLAAPALANDTTGSTITKDDHSMSGSIGQDLVVERTVTIKLEDLVETITETISVTPEKVDILFLADNTGSMGDEIANVQVNAQDILNDLRASYTDTTDIQFGVARYYGAPKEYNMECDYYSCWYKDGGPSVPGDQKIIGTTTSTDTVTTNYTYEGWTYWSGYWYKYSFVTLDTAGNEIDSGETWKWNYNGSSYTETSTESLAENIYGDPVEMDSYELQVAIGGTDTEILQAIGTTSSSDDAYSWKASGGKDSAEGNFFALHQAATSGEATNLGWQTGYDTNWRDDAMKIIVWFGDAYAHDDDITETEAMTALNNNDIFVVAVNVGTGDHTIDKDSQATNITTATSGQYAVSEANNVATTMETLIGDAVESYTITEEITISPKIDIDFRTVANAPLPNGMTITYECIDPNGCDDVGDDESRKFTMTVVGNQADTFNFDTEVFNVDTSNEVVDAKNKVTLYGVD